VNDARRKALSHAIDQFNKHIGHTLTYLAPNTNQGESFKLKRAVLIGETIFLHAENEAFPNHYSDAMFKCSCGEGEK
jgi:hypothetical protein